MEFSKEQLFLHCKVFLLFCPLPVDVIKQLMAQMAL